MNQLVNIFDQKGFGRSWCEVKESGNPVDSMLVKEYIRLIKEEQARSHVLLKKDKPIFLTKVKTMCMFIDRELVKQGIKTKEKFLLYRDQA